VLVRVHWASRCECMSTRERTCARRSALAMCARSRVFISVCMHASAYARVACVYANKLTLRGSLLVSS
jgi:hypothetical protein